IRPNTSATASTASASARVEHSSQAVNCQVPATRLQVSGGETSANQKTGVAPACYLAPGTPLDSEHVLDFVEQAAVFLRLDVAIEGRRQLFEQPALLVTQLGRGLDQQPDLEITSAMCVEVRNALATQADDTPALSASRDFQFFLALEGR